LVDWPAQNLARSAVVLAGPGDAVALLIAGLSIAVFVSPAWTGRRAASATAPSRAERVAVFNVDARMMWLLKASVVV
jgi:hypothetical protein